MIFVDAHDNALRFGGGQVGNLIEICRPRNRIPRFWGRLLIDCHLAEKLHVVKLDETTVGPNDA